MTTDEHHNHTPSRELWEIRDDLLWSVAGEGFANYECGDVEHRGYAAVVATNNYAYLLVQDPQGFKSVEPFEGINVEAAASKAIDAAVSGYHVDDLDGEACDDCVAVSAAGGTHGVDVSDDWDEDRFNDYGPFHTDVPTGYSWSPCDVCGTRQPGRRHAIYRA